MRFSHFSRFCARLEATASRNEITKILSEVFREVFPKEISPVCYLLQGRVGPSYEAIEFGVADKFMIRAIAKAYGKDTDTVIRAFKKYGDMGTAAEALAPGKAQTTLSIGAVYEKLHALAVFSGTGSQEKKIDTLADLLRGCDGLSARYIARITLGKLRLGFSDMTVLDGLSWMLAHDKSHRVELERVYNIRPDIGLLAETVKEHGISGLSRVRAAVGVPILAALCQRLPSAGQMLEKMGEVAVEPKYDGVRCQIHISEKGVQTFSRNLENTTAMFPELVGAGKHINAHEVILDSEAAGMDPKTGRTLPFQETMTRKRKHNIQLAMREVPLKFFVFDILYKDGSDLLNVPLKERRKILETVVRSNGVLARAPYIVTRDAEALRVYHEKQRKLGLEGVVVKKWTSSYEPGRRGFNWVKFKEEEGRTGKLTDTIDAVVMGYYKGEGKRAGFGIGAFLVGVRKGDHFVTVTKIGTGVSDELWRELKRELGALKTVRQPKGYVDIAKTLLPDVWVVPKIVVEVAADDITRSPIHGAKLALRFPRLVRIRTDKSPPMATTVQEVQEMYAAQL